MKTRACTKCKKIVSIYRKEVNIGIAIIWNDFCKECRYLIDSGFKHIYEKLDY